MEAHVPGTAASAPWVLGAPRGGRALTRERASSPQDEHAREWVDAAEPSEWLQADHVDTIAEAESPGESER